MRGLRRLVRERRAARADGRGRLPLPSFVRTLHALERYTVDDEAFRGVDGAVDKLPAEEVRRLLHTIESLRSRLESLHLRLAAARDAPHPTSPRASAPWADGGGFGAGSRP